MPAAPAAFPYLSWKHRKIVLRLPIAKPVQPILGRKMFRQVMAQATMPEAHAASLPIIADWQRQIDAAKTASRDHLQAEIMRLRALYEGYAGKPLDAAEQALFDDILDFLFQTCGGAHATAQRLALANARGDGAKRLASPVTSVASA
jgi:hypothetical protein